MIIQNWMIWTLDKKIFTLNKARPYADGEFFKLLQELFMKIDFHADL